MSYHVLSNETGGTADDRRSEADRIVKILRDNWSMDDLTPKEQEFVFRIEEGGAVSPKQIFWLRDIKEKYL